jgi:hypothetical protein
MRKPANLSHPHDRVERTASILVLTEMSARTVLCPVPKQSQLRAIREHRPVSRDTP